MLSDLESKIAAGEALSRDDAARVAASTDLIAIGALGESVRKALHGDVVTYGRVAVVVDGAVEIGEAGEVRIAARALSMEDALARVAAAKTFSGAVPLTGFSLTDLLDLAGGDEMALASFAAELASAGLEAVADVAVDRLTSRFDRPEEAADVIRAARHGGLQVRRAVIDQADLAQRLELLEHVVCLQRETSAFQAFAPLPRQDPRETPSTGYDDVRTIAVARLRCRSVPSIQVDWPLYGPKLAQVALTYGADDIDGVAAIADAAAGLRRAPREEIERQIRAAFATPLERNGRYETAASGVR